MTFIKFTLALGAVGLMNACSQDSIAVKNSSAVKVLAPVQKGNGSYALDFTELQGLVDLETLSGKYARFYISPRIESGHLKGGMPRARFIKSKGNYIPANEITQQLVTVYTHMQHLAQLDDELGAGGVNKWPRDVGVAVKVKGGLSNNAFYDGSTDSMLFVPYNQQGLPIAINAGILAHEHFHSLFYKMAAPDSPFSSLFDHSEDFHNLVELPSGKAIRERQTPIVMSGEGLDADSMRALYKVVMTRSLNEGLADYWGWMYTGNPDFIAQSLPKEGAARSLKVQDEKVINSLPNRASIERSTSMLLSTGDAAKIKEYAVGYSYTLATQFSRFLKRLSDIHAKTNNIEDRQSRLAIAKVIVKILPKIKETFKSLGEDYFTSEHFVMLFSDEISDLKKEECEYLVEVLNNSKGLSNFQYICQEGARWQIGKQEVPNVEAPTLPNRDQESQ